MTCSFTNINMIFKSKIRINRYIITLVFPDLMKLLSILAVAFTFPEARRWLLPVFTFVQLLLSHVKRVADDFSKLLTTNSILLSALYGAECSAKLAVSLLENKTCHIWKRWTGKVIKMNLVEHQILFHAIN